MSSLHVDNFVKSINETIDTIVSGLVRKERKVCDEEILDHYHKLLRVKIGKDDFEPYKRRLRRRYSLERKKKIKDLQDEHKKKLKELKDQIKGVMMDDQSYVDDLQEIYDVKLVEHKRAIYDAYIKKVSTRSYAEFLKKVVYKTFYVTLSPSTISYWRMQLLNKNNFFEDDAVAASISNSLMIEQIGNITVPAEFIVFYSKFIPYAKNNKKYLEEVVKKVNKQVEVVNYICTEMSCLNILRDILLTYQKGSVTDMIKTTMDWHIKYDEQIQEYIKSKDAEDDDINAEEEDIYDENVTFRRTLRNVDQLIHKTFDPMNNPAYLARTYFNVTDMNNPMMYLALTESSYDVVYNLYLEFLLLVLVYRLNLKLELGLRQTSTPYFDVIHSFQEVETVKHPTTISQMVPGLLVLILLYIHTSKRCPEAMVLFRYNISKIKRRDEIRRYLVDLSLILIRFVIEIVHDPTNFVKRFHKELKNAQFIRIGVPTSL